VNRTMNECRRHWALGAIATGTAVGVTP
jgi:hypothetical protein